jgi:ABC-2 type transport system permease protein
MLIKEFLQMLRDPRMRVVIFVVPVFQMLVLAFALTTDVTDIKTGVLDFDNTPASRELVKAFTAGGYFQALEHPTSQAAIEGLLDRGDVRALIHIPAGFAQDLRSGKTASVQLLADATDSNTTSIVFGYAQQVMEQYNREKLAERTENSPYGQVPMGGVSMETRAWFNTNLESRYYYVPALIAVMLIVVSLLLTSIAIVREKEIGTIEQIMVTPIRRLEFILGKTIPYLITGYIIMTMMLLIAMVVFGVRIHGSLPLLYLLTGIYLIGNVGLALLISVSASTQQQALLTAFFILMPAILLSGFMFPINNMPEPVQYATYLNPMRWYLEILRGVVMKGVGVASLWRAILGQSVLAVGCVLLASARFKKTLA